MALLAAILAVAGCTPPSSRGFQPTLAPILLPTEALFAAESDQKPGSQPTPQRATAPIEPTPARTTAPRTVEAGATPESAVTPTTPAALDSEVPATSPEPPSGQAFPVGEETSFPVGEETPAPLMALGNAPSLTLRALPASGAPVVARIPGSDVLWVTGSSPDGRWLSVTYSKGDLGSGEESAAGWVAERDVVLFGDAATLPIVSGEAPTPAPAARAPAPSPLQGASPGQAGAKGSLEAPPPPVSGGMSGSVTGDTLNVRSGPGTSWRALGQLKQGDAVTVLGRTAEGDWLHVAWKDGQAWVAARFVQVNGDAGSLPITARPPSPAPPPPAALPGRLAFQTRSGGDIYVMDTDGSAVTGLRRVADGIDPALSPDGSRLAYARWGAPNGIFIQDLKTGQETLVAGVTHPRGPTWSPDGNQLAFTYSTRNYVCLMSPWGCLEEEALRQAMGGECLNTPFGRFCISDFPSQQVDDYGLVQVNLADGARLDLPAQKTVQSPQWRPGSDEILYRGDKGFQITAPGGDTRPLTGDPDMGSPAWSPDGQRIAVQRRLHDHSDIFLLDAAGNVQKRLTEPPSPFDRAPDNVAPVWSPDGRYILFLSNRAEPGGDGDPGKWRMYRMNADGSNQTLFAPGALGNIDFNYDFAAERVASWSR